MKENKQGQIIQRLQGSYIVWKTAGEMVPTNVARAALRELLTVARQ